eukprot:400814_1
MFNVMGLTFNPTVPLQFYVDMYKLSQKEIELLSPLAMNATFDMQQMAILFKKLIEINPTYGLYHSKYANALSHFKDQKQTLHQRQLAYQCDPTNTGFIMDYIECLDFRKDNVIKQEMLSLFSVLITRIELYQQILSQKDPNELSIKHESENDNMLSIFGYLSKFPFLSYLHSCQRALERGFIQCGMIDTSLNQFIADCYDKYYTFQCLYNGHNGQNCDFNQAFKYAEMCIDLAPHDWHKIVGISTMYCLKGRYVKGGEYIHQIFKQFNLFEPTNKIYIEKKQGEINKLLYPDRISQLHLIYLRVLIKLEKFEMAHAKYKYLLNNKMIDEKDNIYFCAVKIELFTHLSMYYKSQSSKYIKQAFGIYNNNKQNAMYDKDNNDLFFANYAFLLIVSGNVETAMHLLEKRATISNETGGWIEYLNGYIQQYKIGNNQHAKYHYFASMAHNNQIPEVRYHLCILLIKMKEYKMSYFQLKNAINMDSGLPIINKNRHKLLKHLRKKMKLLKCANCARLYYAKSKNEKTLSVCKGCGKSYYCNKSCQKKHWNQIHRTQCDKLYVDIFKQFK